MTFVIYIRFGFVKPHFYHILYFAEGENILILYICLLIYEKVNQFTQ